MATSRNNDGKKPSRSVPKNFQGRSQREVEMECDDVVKYFKKVHACQQSKSMFDQSTSTTDLSALTEDLNSSFEMLSFSNPRRVSMMTASSNLTHSEYFQQSYSSHASPSSETNQNIIYTLTLLREGEYKKINFNQISRFRNASTNTGDRDDGIMINRGPVSPAYTLIQSNNDNQSNNNNDKRSDNTFECSMSPKKVGDSSNNEKIKAENDDSCKDICDANILQTNDEPEPLIALEIDEEHILAEEALEMYFDKKFGGDKPEDNEGN